MTVYKSRKVPIRLTPSRLSEIHYLPPPTPSPPRMYPKVSPFAQIHVKAPHWSPRLYPKLSAAKLSAQKLSAKKLSAKKSPRLSPMYNLPPPAPPAPHAIKYLTPTAPMFSPMYKNLPPPNMKTHNWTPKRSPLVAQIAYVSPRIKSPIVASINVAGIAKTLQTSPQQIKSIVKNVLAGDLIRDNVEQHVLAEDNTKNELALQMSVLSNVPKGDQTQVSKILEGIKEQEPGTWSNIVSGFKNNKFYAIALGAVIIAAGVYIKFAYFTKPETWTEMIIRYIIESFYGKPAYSLYRLSATINLVKANSREILDKVTGPFKRLLGIYQEPPELSKVAKAIKYGRALSWLLLVINPDFMGFHQLMFGTALGASYLAAGPVGNVVERIFGGRQLRKHRKNRKHVRRVLRKHKK